MKRERIQKGFGVVGLLITVLVVSAVFVAGWYASSAEKDNSSTTTSASDTVEYPGTNEAINVVKNLILGMKTSDKGLVDSTLSSELKARLKEEAGTESFYDACSRDGAAKGSCLSSYNAFNLDNATTKFTDFSEVAELGGITVTIGSSSTLEGKQVVIEFDFHLIQNDNSWLILDIQESQTDLS
jgi:hypothetical protein